MHVVHDDAPLDQAVDGVVEGIGTDQRVLVAESVAEEFGELLRARIARLRVGDPLDANTDVGPVGSRQRRDRVRARGGGRRRGRRAASPARARCPTAGLFLAPVVLTDVGPTTRAGPRGDHRAACCRC